MTENRRRRFLISALQKRLILINATYALILVAGFAALGLYFLLASS